MGRIMRVLNATWRKNAQNAIRDDQWRIPTGVERQVLERLLANNFPGHDMLLRQLEGLRVRTVDKEGSIALDVRSTDIAPVLHRVPIEAQYSDVDTVPDVGPYVRVLLHVVDGKMSELEIYKDDDSPIRTDLASAELEEFFCP
jgi:hypothetical protein